MKIFLSLLLLVFVCNNNLLAQGKYAGTKKSLIGKAYSDSRNIPGLTGWQFSEGSLLTAIDDLEVITADVFKKGTTYIVLFSIKEDTADVNYTIADIIEIKNILKSQHIQTGLCREGENESVEIVALAKQETSDFSKAIKAWCLNRDKRRVEGMNSKLVKCMNEGGD